MIALETNRAYETDAAMFQAELVSIRNNYENQLAELCGTFEGADGLVHPAIRTYAYLDPLAKLGLWADDVTHVFLTHHHLDHTMNIGLFRKAEVVDFRASRRGDQVTNHAGEGYQLAPHTAIWLTPGHTPQDASLVVDTPEGRYAFTHLWWRSDRSPAVDPYSTDPGELARNRQRVLTEVNIVIPGHGAPFKVR